MQRIVTLILVSCALTACDFEYEPCDNSGEAGAAASSRSCPNDSICLDVKPPEGGTIRAGHVAVVWSQLDEADPDPEPQIAYDATLDGSTRRVVIRVSDITPPKDEALLLCERACDDESACGCRSAVRVATATVITADDANKDGRVDGQEVRTNTYGRAATVIVRSDREYRPAPAPFDAVFADAILAGTHAYAFVGKGADVRLGSPEEGQAFDLFTCSEPGPRCELPFPELRDF